MESKFKNSSHETDKEILKSFKALYEKLEEKIFSCKNRNIDEMSYPVVIDHFTDIAHNINEGKKFTLEELTTSFENLDKKLLTKEPMSEGQRAVIYGVIAALVGGAIGFLIGAAITFWGGGFGALPFAIAGSALGEGLVMGGGALGTGLVFGAIGAKVGLFKAKSKRNEYDKKQSDKEDIKQDADAIYKSIRLDKK